MNADRLWFLFDVWLVWMAAGFLHMWVAWVTLQRWGGGAPEFKIFYGKPLATVVWRRTSFILGWIPLGFYVKYNEEVFPYLPWRLRAANPLTGPVAVALGAGLLLGFWNLWEQLGKSFGQILQAALHPIAVAVPLLERAHAAALPWTVLTGLLWTRYVAFHCLPIPGLPGSAWWVEVFRRPPEEKILGWLGVIGFFIVFPAWISFAVAAWRFVAGGTA
jgi:hypothetical protein